MALKQTRRSLPEVMVATRTFWIGSQLVRAGDTVVAGHALLKGRENLFRPFVPTFGVLPVVQEAPSAPPLVQETPKSAAASGADE